MTASVDRWADVYRDVHAHPELGFAETRTAGIVESHLVSMGFEVTAGVGAPGWWVLSVTVRGPLWIGALTTAATSWLQH